MANFNGRLRITSLNLVDDKTWDIVGIFTDNTSVYSAKQAQVGDVIYAKAENPEGDSDFKLYKITAIDQANTKASRLFATIEFAEEYSDDSEIFTPFFDDDAMVCRLTSEHGFALIANTVNGFTQSDVDTIRNLTLEWHDKKITEYIDNKAGNGGGNTFTSINVADSLNVSASGKDEKYTGENLVYNTEVTATGDIEPNTSFESINGSVTKTDSVTASVTATNTSSVIAPTVRDTTTLVGTASAVKQINLSGIETRLTVNLSGSQVSDFNIIADTISAENSDLTVKNVIISNDDYDSFEDTNAASVGYLKQYVSEHASDVDLTEITEKVNTNIQNIASLTDTINNFAPVTEPGTYTEVTVNEKGFVTSGRTHTAIDITGTTNDSFSIGSSEGPYSYVYAFPKTSEDQAVPFIRYNFADRLWEISDDGRNIRVTDVGDHIEMGTVDIEPELTIDLDSRSQTNNNDETTPIRVSYDLNAGDSLFG